LYGEALKSRMSGHAILPGVVKGHLRASYRS
jgi:hypothetical protein